MNRKILALDIDGTLLNSDKVITPKTKQALLDMQKAGHVLVLASGRPTPGVVAYANELQLDQFGGYVLSFNGAKITNWQTKEVVYQSCVPDALFTEIYDFAEKNDCGVVTYTEDTAISGRRIDEYLAYEARVNGLPIVEVDDFVSYSAHKPNKCLMTEAPERCAELEQMLHAQLGEQLSIFRSEPYFLEVMPLNVDKGASLDRLAQHLGMQQADTICCGDGFNDTTMIAYAGVGVAMDNAQQAVKDVADFVTGNNNEDGLVTVIEKFIM